MGVKTVGHDSKLGVDITAPHITWHPRRSRPQIWLALHPALLFPGAWFTGLCTRIAALLAFFPGARAGRLCTRIGFAALSRCTRIGICHICLLTNEMSRSKLRMMKSERSPTVATGFPGFGRLDYSPLSAIRRRSLLLLATLWDRLPNEAPLEWILRGLGSTS
jgi:hypothetical protein